MMLPSMKFENTVYLWKGIPNSYSQIFFSDNKWFGWLLAAVTFINPYAGISGILAVILSNALALWLGYDKTAISKGIYGFNSLLTALGLGVTFEHSWQFIIVIILATFLNLFISVSLQGILSKYYLPFLSIPFLITIWIIVLATRSFESLALNDKGIFALNELYNAGGEYLVRIYEGSLALSLPISLKAYFSSLGAIFFQFNVIAGIAIAIGLFLFSRIAFSLSLLGFYSAWWFYQVLGVDMSIFIYNYVGFNFILTAIAIGGYFFVPSRASYFWTVVLTPLVALITISFYNLFLNFQLPVFSLSFNLVVLMFIYALKMRIYPSGSLSEVYIQRHSAEENLYTHLISKKRFRFVYHIPVKLPFWGEWTISQGHNGEYTHKEEYRQAWDFVITDNQGKQYKNSGHVLSDYYCFEKAVIAPADGIVSDIQDGIADNSVGKENLVNNWGNTVVIKHSETLFSNISHLKEQSIKVKKGDHVKAGDIMGACGNSGRSPYPHLHFQMQATPYIGSKTIEYPVSHYIKNDNGTFTLHSFDSPIENDTVSNIQNNKLLQKAFEFKAGQVVEMDIHIHNTIKRAKWEVVTDIYNKSYLWEKESKSSAYFMNDSTLFRFTHFEGSKKSLLYIVYLALYEVLQASYKNVTVESEFPIYQIFNPVSLYAHDLIAPFHCFAFAKYTLKYKLDETALTPDKITLLSEVTTEFIKKRITKFSFEVIISDKGVEEIKVKTHKYSTLTH